MFLTPGSFPWHFGTFLFLLSPAFLVISFPNGSLPHSDLLEFILVIATDLTYFKAEVSFPD